MLKSLALAASIAISSFTVQAAITKPTDVTTKTYKAKQEVILAPKSYKMPDDINLTVIREDVASQYVEPTIINLIRVRDEALVPVEDRFDLIAEGQYITKDLLRLLYGVEDKNIYVGDLWFGGLSTGEGDVTVIDVTFSRNNKIYYARVLFFITDTAGNWFVVYPVTK